MNTSRCDVLVIGGGPAGLAAACAARQQGAGRVVILERNDSLGGILPQCIHNGFGVRVFQEDLTGPEYASRWIEQAQQLGVEALSRTMVLAIEPGLRVAAVNGQRGLIEMQAKALVLAMGCRERPRGALAIPGTRPAGIYTAGTAQRLVNIEGYMPGRRFVILGSGDIGMIMARRLTLEGADVAAMLEIQPYVSGLRRNLVQCVRDYDIPLHLCTTVTRIVGHERVQAVITSQVDEHWRPIPGSEREISCDTLLFSVGLIPENELSRMVGVSIDACTGGPFVDEQFATSIPGIYAAGNVVHVYDLVDEVTAAALRAGRAAARYACGGPTLRQTSIPVLGGENVHHVLPQHIDPQAPHNEPLKLELRVRTPIEETVRVEIKAGDKTISTRRLRYARPSEMVALELQASQIERLVGADCLTISVTKQLTT
jgi:NADPH-dependent 2,4-dienoyl-CoA reductase/sulfur reductase-like enzyme